MPARRPKFSSGMMLVAALCAIGALAPVARGRRRDRPPAALYGRPDFALLKWVISNRRTSERRCRAALRFSAPRRPRWLTPHFLARIVNDPKYTRRRRADCLVALVRLFMQPPISLGKFTALLGHPQWAQHRFWIGPNIMTWRPPISCRNIPCDVSLRVGPHRILGVWIGVHNWQRPITAAEFRSALAGHATSRVDHRRIREIAVVYELRNPEMKTILDRLSPREYRRRLRARRP